MRKMTFTLGCLMLSCICTFAQLKNWSIYTNTDIVMCMQNDGEYLWIGTNGGLVKLNKQNGGKQFYNRCDGLPETRVSALTTNKKGELWTSSENCVIAKFNGTGFDVLNATASLPDKPTYANYALSVDEEDQLWYGAVAVYTENKEDGSSKITGWELPEAAISSTSITQAHLFTTVNEEEVLYIGGNIGRNYLLRLDGNGLTSVLKGQIASAVTGLAQGKDESIWITTEKSGLIHYSKDGTLTIYNTGNSDIPSNYIHDIKADHEGNYWLACDCSLVKFDGKDFTIYQTDLIKSMSNTNFITKIATEEDGTVWLGTKWQGLFKFTEGKFSKIDISPTPLTDNQMAYSMCLDKEGNLWNAGRQALLKIDRNNEWHNLFKSDNESLLTSNRIQAVGSDRQGNVWVALSMSDTCIVKMSPKGEIIEAFTKSTHPALAGGTLRESCFAFDLKGNVWWGAYAALYRYDGKTWEYFTSDNSPIPCNAITDLKVDSKGTLWGTAGFIGDTGGLFKWDGSTWTIYTTENSGLPTCFALCLDIDSQDRIWLHCRDKGGYVGKVYGGGLTCFDGERWTSYTTENSEIPSNTIWDIAIDKMDRIWMGTAEAGLTCLDGEDWTNYNTDNSDIASNQVSCIQIDDYRNCIWMNHLSCGGMSSVEFEETYGMEELSTGCKVQIGICRNSIRANATGASLLEIYSINGMKVGEARFADGEATVKVGEAPAMYLYIVTYPDGRRESGKARVSEE